MIETLTKQAKQKIYQRLIEPLEKKIKNMKVPTRNHQHLLSIE